MCLDNVDSCVMKLYVYCYVLISIMCFLILEKIVKRCLIGVHFVNM